jgi:cell wall-associated NlpC family hydrolase
MNTRTPYFHTVARVTELEREAAEWIGTPWLPGSCLKHYGADCGRFAAGLYSGCNAHPYFRIPETVSFTSRQTDSIVNWLKGFDRLRSVNERGLAPGDLLVFSRTHIHMAVVLQNSQLIHCLNPCGVQYGSALDPVLMTNLVHVFEVLE